jgi:quercetin dioxygenase-like cupin family protein
MNRFTSLAVVSAVLCWSGSVLAQDPVKVDPAHYKLVLENASVRVLKVSLPAGAKTPMHAHPDTIIVPLTNSKVRFTMSDGKSVDSDLAADSAQYTPAGLHAGANLGGAGDVIVVEFKGAAPGKAQIPTARPGLTLNVLADGARGLAYKSTAAPAFAEPAGSTHEFDQVVIALGAAQMSLSINGKPARTSWARGDVQFIGRGVPHEAKNTGGKPVDFIIIGVR